MPSPASSPSASTAALSAPTLTASVTMPRCSSPVPKVNTSQVHNRILALMAHTNRYAFKGESRLAHDAGMSKSVVCPCPF